METAPARPKVFVSYSWSGPEHIQEIISLARRLSEDNGVEVVLDQWSLREGHDRLKDRWYPVTLLYLRNRESLPFFLRCAGTEGIKNLCQIMGVDSQQDLLAKLETASTPEQSWASFNYGYGYGYNLNKILLVDKWGTEHFPTLD